MVKCTGKSVLKGIAIGKIYVYRKKEFTLVKTYIEDGLSIHYPSGRSRSPSRGYFSH